MSTFSMTCDCGDTMKVDAGSRGEAVNMLQGMMNEDAIAKHMAEKHPGQSVIPMAQVHAMIAQKVQAVA